MIKVCGYDITIFNDKIHGQCIFIYVKEKWQFLTYFKDIKINGDLAHQAYCAMYYNY